MGPAGYFGYGYPAYGYGFYPGMPPPPSGDADSGYYGGPYGYPMSPADREGYACSFPGYAPPSGSPPLLGLDDNPKREAPAAPRSSAETPRLGDWFCPKCGDLQFARNSSCRKCSTPKPSGAGLNEESGPTALVSSNHQKMMPGDWLCYKCGDLQFARNSKCRQCGAPKPESAGGRDGSRSRSRSRSHSRSSSRGQLDRHQPQNGGSQPAGDWFCPSCNDLQFGRDSQCRSCKAPRPPG